MCGIGSIRSANNTYMYIMSHIVIKDRVIKAQAYSCVECSTLHVHILSTIFMEVKGVGWGWGRWMYWTASLKIPVPSD